MGVQACHSHIPLTWGTDTGVTVVLPNCRFSDFLSRATFLQHGSFGVNGLYLLMRLSSEL